MLKLRPIYPTRSRFERSFVYRRAEVQSVAWSQGRFGKEIAGTKIKSTIPCGVEFCPFLTDSVQRTVGWGEYQQV